MSRAWGVIGAILIIIVAGVVGYAIGHRNYTCPTTSSNQTMPPSNQTTPPAGGGTQSPSVNQIVVTMKNIAFNPQDVTINTGETIVWENDDNVDHHVVSNTGVFDSGVMTPGSSYSFTFSTAGTYAYHCSIHPSMTGTITVK